MLKKIHVFIFSSIILPSFLWASDYKIGDILKTKQDGLDFHVGVVVYVSGNDVILADHGPREDGKSNVRLTHIDDFRNGEVSISLEVPEQEKSEPLLIVARAISALFSNVKYDIAQKNCSVFTEWCVKGGWEGFSDFRKEECLSLNCQMRQFRKWCDGTEEGKQKIIDSLIANEIKEETINIVRNKSVEELKYLNNESILIWNIKEEVKNKDLNIKYSNPEKIPSLSKILGIDMEDNDIINLCNNIVNQNI